MKKTIISLAFAGLLAACGGSQHPDTTTELAEARIAYLKAEKGPASKYFPEQLKSAKASLDEAERAYTEEGGSDKVRDLAIVASRKSTELAAQANAAEAQALQRSQAVQEQMQNKEESLEKMRKANLTAQSVSTSAQNEELYKKLQQTIYKRGFIAKENRGIVLTVPVMELFRKEESVFVPAGQSLLGSIASQLKGSNANIIVEGHTDTTGNEATNRELSLARAQAARNYLVSQGVRSELARAEGMGSARPLDTSMTPEGRTRNRRIEIIISSQ